MRIKLSETLLAKNPKFNKAEHNLIIKTLLNKISLTTKRASVVNIKINKFGTFHTHRNKKKMGKLKYLRKWNKTNWLKTKKEKEMSINYLLW